MSLLRFFIIVALYCGAAHLSCATLYEYPENTLRQGRNLLTAVYDAVGAYGTDASEENIANYAITLNVGVVKCHALYNAIRLYKEFLVQQEYILPAGNMEHLFRRHKVWLIAQKEPEGVQPADHYQKRHNMKNVTQEDIRAVLATEQFIKTTTFRTFIQSKILPYLNECTENIQIPKKDDDME